MHSRLVVVVQQKLVGWHLCKSRFKILQIFSTLRPTCVSITFNIYGNAGQPCEKRTNEKEQGVGVCYSSLFYFLLLSQHMLLCMYIVVSFFFIVVVVVSSQHSKGRIHIAHFKVQSSQTILGVANEFLDFWTNTFLFRFNAVQ